MAELPGLELPAKPRETERSMLDRLRVRFGRTYMTGRTSGASS